MAIDWDAVWESTGTVAGKAIDSVLADRAAKRTIATVNALNAGQPQPPAPAPAFADKDKGLGIDKKWLLLGGLGIAALIGLALMFGGKPAK